MVPFVRNVQDLIDGPHVVRAAGDHSATRSERQAPKSLRTRLTDAMVAELVAAFRAGATGPKLADRYGVSLSSVKRVLRGSGARRHRARRSPRLRRLIDDISVITTSKSLRSWLVNTDWALIQLRDFLDATRIVDDATTHGGWRYGNPGADREGQAHVVEKILDWSSPVGREASERQRTTRSGQTIVRQYNAR
jgi:hypothetical protein